NLGYPYGPTVLHMSYRGAFDPIVPEDDPQKAFARLIGDSGLSATDLKGLQRRRTSVLDAVLGNLNTLKAKLGPDDQAKLELHATSIRELEKQIMTTSGKTCGALTPPPASTAGGLPVLPDRNSPAFPAFGKAQVDLIVQALACGLTRV